MYKFYAYFDTKPASKNNFPGNIVQLWSYFYHVRPWCIDYGWFIFVYVFTGKIKCNPCFIVWKWGWCSHYLCTLMHWYFAYWLHFLTPLIYSQPSVCVRHCTWYIPIYKESFPSLTLKIIPQWWHTHNIAQDCNAC